MTQPAELILPPIDPAAAATLPGFLDEIAGKFGSREALVLHDALRGGARVSWSYDELRARSRAVARALIAAGVEKGARVGILIANRPEFAAALFGVALAGGVAVTLSTLSTAEELATLLNLSDVGLVLTQRQIGKHRLDEQIAELFTDRPMRDHGSIADPRFPYLTRFIVLGLEGEGRLIQGWESFLAGGERVADALLDARAARVSMNDTAVIIFTSGTTSQPKGVIHLQRTFVWQFRWQSHIYGRGLETRIWSPFPLFWSAGIVSVLGSTLAVGGCWIGQEVFEPGEALALMTREKVTEPYGFPTHTAALAEHPDWPTADLSSLTRVRGNNEFDSHPNTRPDPTWNMIVAYGMSESCTAIVSHLSTAPVEDQAKNSGRPLPGVQLRIVDFETGASLPAGGEGEICVRGPTMMERYVGFAREECFDADGFFHSGDTGFIDGEGYLHWTGRIKNMVKTGGANVASGEVEAAATALGTLKLCRVIGMPDRRLGEMVVLCAVKADGVETTEDEVRAAIRQRLAAYKTPKRVLFFSIEDYPLTASGKVKDKELRELVAARTAPSPEPSES